MPSDSPNTRRAFSSRYADKLARGNEAMVRLRALQSWWKTLDEGETVKKARQDKLVRETEDTIEALAAGSAQGCWAGRGICREATCAHPAVSFPSPPAHSYFEGG